MMLSFPLSAMKHNATKPVMSDKPDKKKAKKKAANKHVCTTCYIDTRINARLEELHRGDIGDTTSRETEQESEGTAYNAVTNSTDSANGKPAGQPNNADHPRHKQHPPCSECYSSPEFRRIWDSQSATTQVLKMWATEIKEAECRLSFLRERFNRGLTEHVWFCKDERHAPPGERANGKAVQAGHHTAKGARGDKHRTAMPNVPVSENNHGHKGAQRYIPTYCQREEEVPPQTDERDSEGRGVELQSGSETPIGRPAAVVPDNEILAASIRDNNNALANNGSGHEQSERCPSIEAIECGDYVAAGALHFSDESESHFSECGSEEGAGAHDWDDGHITQAKEEQPLPPIGFSGGVNGTSEMDLNGPTASNFGSSLQNLPTDKGLPDTQHGTATATTHSARRSYCEAARASIGESQDITSDARNSGMEVEIEMKVFKSNAGEEMDGQDAMRDDLPRADAEAETSFTEEQEKGAPWKTVTRSKRNKSRGSKRNYKSSRRRDTSQTLHSFQFHPRTPK